VSKRDLFSTENGYIYQYGNDAATDPGTTLIGCVLETGDLDLNFPDRDKTFTRLTVRLQDRPTSDVVFNVYGRNDGHTTATDNLDGWSSYGQITITTADKEGKVNFRLTGSTCRFRITSESNVASYIISEVGLRVKGRGIEVSFD
jgi:hypothetical protein